MKPKTKTPTQRRKATVPTMQTLMNSLRRPFTNPTPASDAALRRFGPKHPVPATKQTRGTN